MKAEPHPRQKERIALLHSYGILDTPREEDFDEIVRLTATICEAPISVVNLIDEERQWFKAETGLGVRETPLDTSLCSHVVLDSAFVEIPDTLSDPRMSDNPLCLADGGLRFYAGALLMGEGDLPLGTLCVLDTKPRTLTAHQREAIRVLSRQVMAQLDLRRALRRSELLRLEADHRVKNSLAATAALVRIRGRSAQVAEVRDALGDVEKRIGSVATLHAHLNGAAHGDRVRLEPFLRDVTKLVAQGLPRGAGLTAEFDDAEAGSRAAIAFATILNEAISNAIKHALAQGGAIRVEGHASPEGYALRVVDDGGGPASDPAAKVVAPASADGSLGAEIMRAAAAQLGGTIAIGPRAGGAGFEVAVNAVPEMMRV